MKCANVGIDATSVKRRWTFILDKGDGSEDEVGEESVEEVDTHRLVCGRL